MSSHTPDLWSGLYHSGVRGGCTSVCVCEEKREGEREILLPCTCPFKAHVPPIEAAMGKLMCPL